MDVSIQQVLVDLRTRLETTYGSRLSRVVLYGSHARGSADTDSDIDLLVVLRGRVSPCEEIARTADDVTEVSLKHNVVVACAFVSQEQFKHEESPLLMNVRREGVPL
jgi:predicted nucleotidyltransferase